LRLTTHKRTQREIIGRMKSFFFSTLITGKNRKASDFRFVDPTQNLLCESDNIDKYIDSLVLVISVVPLVCCHGQVVSITIAMLYRRCKGI
jgi:hypothetical protein